MNGRALQATCPGVTGNATHARLFRSTSGNTSLDVTFSRPICSPERVEVDSTQSSQLSNQAIQFALIVDGVRTLGRPAPARPAQPAAGTKIPAHRVRRHRGR